MNSKYFLQGGKQRKKASDAAPSKSKRRTLHEACGIMLETKSNPTPQRCRYPTYYARLEGFPRKSFVLDPLSPWNRRTIFLPTVDHNLCAFLLFFLLVKWMWSNSCEKRFQNQRQDVVDAWRCSENEAPVKQEYWVNIFFGDRKSVV